jgi:hypothetical protein
MVLANGQYMFTCENEQNIGKYNLDVPLDDNGQITLYAFVSGLSPYKKIISLFTPENYIRLNTTNPDAKMPVVTTTTDTNASTDSGWVRITGTVESEGSPLCSMVLANGQYMFSCGTKDGLYDLTVPLDGDGQITLYVFVSGFQPYKRVFSPS